jgi:hypothetical protein
MEAMMQPDQEARAYVVRTLERVGAKDTTQYVKLLAATPANRIIEGLDPWFFPPDPERAIGFCSEAAGRPVLPFAQAVGEDMMACFKNEPAVTPGVIVINPWAEDKAKIILAELPDFDAWLAYAQKVSRFVQAREREESDDE